MDVNKELIRRTQEVEAILDQYLPKETGYQKTIFQAMNYSLKVGGKRLRPILMQETYRLFGGTSSALQPFMAAIEMIHTYSLVHDDLPAMDNDLLRRGQPTTHARFGEAMGVLAGDALLNYAFETALQALDRDPANPAVARSLQILAAKAGVYGMIGGQVADVEAEECYDISKERLNFIYRLKTGALIEASMMIGALLGGASPEETDRMEQVASKIGLAFQIQDDILDVTGKEEVLGKPIGSDERNQKPTYVVFEGLDASRAKVEELTKEGIDRLAALPYDNPFLMELLRWMVFREK
jgi:geranylgeranyl diphosphate synthase type II